MKFRRTISTLALLLCAFTATALERAWAIIKGEQLDEPEPVSQSVDCVSRKEGD